MTYLYVQSEEQLWTVGSGEPGTSSWQPESDHGSDDDAARRLEIELYSSRTYASWRSKRVKPGNRSSFPGYARSCGYS